MGYQLERTNGKLHSNNNSFFDLKLKLPDGTISWEIHQFSANFPDLMAMLCLAFFIHSGPNSKITLSAHFINKKRRILVNLYKAVITLLKNNEKPENNTRDLSIGYLLVALTYSIIGSLFFLTFPDNKGLDGDTTGVIGHQHFCSVNRR